MDIKEIAMKVGLQVFEEHPYDKGHVVSPSDYTWIDDKLIEFAEALIESYKAELLKEVGEPVAELVLCISANGFGTEWRTDESAWWSAVEPERRAKVFTSDQLAAAILKATKPLEEKIERLKRQSANRLIGLCKGGEDNDELRTQLAAAQEEIRSREDFIAMLQETQKDQLAKAEQLWQIAQGRCDGLEEKLAKVGQLVAEACAELAYAELDDPFLSGHGYANRVSEAIRSGEWRKFVKEMWK